MHISTHLPHLVMLVESKSEAETSLSDGKFDDLAVKQRLCNWISSFPQFCVDFFLSATQFEQNTRMTKLNRANLVPPIQVEDDNGSGYSL